MTAVLNIRLFLLVGFVCHVATLDAADVVYALDFTNQQSGAALPWLKQQGFQFKLAFEALNPRFENGALVLSAERPKPDCAAAHLPKGKNCRELSGCGWRGEHEKH